MISSQLQRLAKGTAIYGVGQVLNRFIGFLLLPVFTSYLSPKEYGISAILLMLSGILTCVFSLGIGVSSGICYYDGDGVKHRANTVWTATWILGLSVLFFLVMGLPGSGLISFVAFGSTDYGYLVCLTLITAGLAMVVQPSILYLQFEEKATLFIILSATLTVFSFASSVLFVVFLKRGVKGLVEANAVSQLASLFVYFSVMTRELKPSYDVLLAKNLIKIGLPYILGFLSFFLIQYVDRYMLELYCGLNVVGTYSVGYNIGMMAMLIVGAFSAAWTPYFNSFVNRQEDASYLFSYILTYYIMGMGFLSLLMFLFAKPIVSLMTASPFHVAYTVVGIVSLAQAIYGCYLIFLPGLYYAKKTGIVNSILVGACLLNIILNSILIPWINMLGAAMATVASFLAMTIMTHFAARKYLVVTYDWMRILRYLASWAVAVTIYYVAPKSSLFVDTLTSTFVLIAFVSANYLYLNEKEQAYIKKKCYKIFVLRSTIWKKC